MNIWGIEKKIKEIRYALKRAIENEDKRRVIRCKRSISSLKKQVEKIRRERKNGKKQR
jgi:hypothetical protein